VSVDRCLCAIRDTLGGLYDSWLAHRSVNVTAADLTLTTYYPKVIVQVPLAFPRGEFQPGQCTVAFQ
jgi:hypothetical protein